MSVPRCRAAQCGGIADDGTGWCAAHRRALTLTVKVADAVHEFLHGNHLPQSAIRPTGDNPQKVTQAGEHIAQGLASLISTRLHNVRFEPAPLAAINLSYAATPPWRVSFAWHANQTEEPDMDEEPDDDNEEYEDDDATVY